MIQASLKLSLVMFIAVFVWSCNHNQTGEGVTLPEMNFEFACHPDTSQITLGDTLTIETGISNTSGGVRLDDGKAVLSGGIGYFPETPIVDPAKARQALENEDYIVIVDDGGFDYSSSQYNLAIGYAAHPFGDSIRMKYRFIFLKKGTYQFYIKSGFYEGSKGKAAITGVFISNPNWDLWQSPQTPVPQPGDYEYNTNFFIAVL